MKKPEEYNSSGIFKLTLREIDFFISSDMPDFLERCIRLHYGDAFSIVEEPPPPGSAYHLDICSQPPESDFSRIEHIVSFPILNDDSRFNIAFDSKQKSAVACVGGRDYQELARYYFSALSTFLQLCFKEKGIYVFHASSVRFAGRGIIIAGDNGSGKSTTMRRLLEMGADYLSDDSSVIASGDHGVRIVTNPELLNATDISPETRAVLIDKGFAPMPDGYFFAPPRNDIAAPVDGMIFPGFVKEHASVVSLTKKESLIKLLSYNKTPLIKDDYEDFFTVCGNIVENSSAISFFIGRNMEFPTSQLKEFCENL